MDEEVGEGGIGGMPGLLAATESGLKPGVKWRNGGPKLGRSKGPGGLGMNEGE